DVYKRQLHRHTDYPIRAVFKNIQDISYSEREYLSGSTCFDSIRIESGFCPVCVQEDVKRLGFSFWRRAHCSELKVCAEHNVVLVKRCPACGRRFSYGGHALNVLWKTCGGTNITDCTATLNTDQIELKKSKIYMEILSFPHHISEEAALSVLNKKVHLDDTYKCEVNYLGYPFHVGSSPGSAAEVRPPSVKW
ncbi:hypothetical protein QN371_21595, partial [Pseudomonas sp. CCC4.3]|nr:hypothetical protein [Pseudomonas sp. CCC4.3]